VKVIIAGGRDIDDPDLLEEALDDFPYEITEVVCGLAPGVDLLGKSWAKRNDIPVVEFPAEWDRYGKLAGPIRNRKMAKYADVLLLIWNGLSPGSANMSKEMIKERKPAVRYLLSELYGRINKEISSKG